MPNLTPMQLEVATLMVEALNLEQNPAEIAPDEPLFYDGLGLDSIDALELALEIGQRYGFELKAEDEENKKIFASLRAITDHIDQNKTK